MEDAANTQRFGPRPISLLTVFLRSFAGLGGGIIGTFILLVVFLLASSILQPALTPDGTDVHPLFIFVFMAMLFLATVGSNLVSVMLLALTDRSKYVKFSSIVTQTFSTNIVVFIFSAPLYLIASSIDLTFVAYVAGLHVIISLMASALVMEIIADFEYALVGVYGIILAVLAGAGANFLIYQVTMTANGGVPNATLLLFVAMPLLWLLLGFMTSAVNMFYEWVFRAYGTDFLRASLAYGVDYGTPEAPPPPTPEETRKDLSGSDFLLGKQK